MEISSALDVHRLRTHVEVICPRTLPHAPDGANRPLISTNRAGIGLAAFVASLPVVPVRHISRKYGLDDVRGG
jgi:hypothetical protein